MHIVLGNQRRLAFLSAALKGKVGPIRATAHWLPQPIGSIGLVRHGIERSVPLSSPPARLEAQTAPSAPFGLQHPASRYREIQEIC